MKIPAKKFLLKSLKITGISISSILLLLYLLPILFPGTIGEKIKGWTNQHIDGEMNFSKVRLSFFRHFPSFTVSLHDFSLKGSAPFKKDTLISADEIAFGINLKSLIFDNKINIDKIFVSDADMNVQVNEKGEANYNVYISDTNKKESANDSSSATLRLERISIKNSHLRYNDKSVQLLFDAKGFNYKGNGDLSKAIFDLNSHAEIDSLDFYFENEPYLLNKKINADLVTKINTNSLTFIFQQNNLQINKLPVQFNGKLDFLKNGYDLDFTVNSKNSNLYDFVTALPPQYLQWQQKATIKGSTDLLLTLKGQYIASSNAMPDLTFNMKIRDGFIAYEKAPFPASNLFLNLDTKLSSLNRDSLLVKVDSIFFNVDKDYLSAVVQTKGITKPFISAKINAVMDLERMDKAFGLQLIDLKGKLDLHCTANGLYEYGPNPNSLRHENILLSIPSFNIKANVRDGYFKYNSLPQSINKINFTSGASCVNNDYKNTAFSIAGFSAEAMNNFISGNVSVSSLKEMNIVADVKSAINLGEIKNFYPLDGLDIKGMLKVNVNAKGKYNKNSKEFPLSTVDFVLNNGSVKTAYYPNPVSNIEVNAKATDADGTLKGLQLDIQPASFQFEGKPFQVQANLQDFDDIAYNIKANGEIDVAKIYKVFLRKNLDVSGFIKADLSLSGKQSDAMQKHYSRLHNEGTLELKDIKAVSEYFPQPFIIREGLFKFSQDKMWFNNFKAVYGQSDFNMNGYLQNVIDYALSDKAVLQGNFKVKSDFINADEFMVFTSENTTAKTDTINKTVANAETGVIIIPSNLDISLDANVAKVSFNGLNIENGKGNVSMNKSTLALKQTGFNLAGCDVLMDAAYASISPVKASFDYHVQAKDFDIKRAYNEIKLFHDMATAAGKAEGIVSLDYNLKGVLDENMKPIYPSLEGGGVLSVKKVKVKGFKLFSAVSRKTGKDSIANPDVSQVDIKSRIKNNIITLERFKIKMAGFRLRIEGQTNFDGRLNLKMRLGLPPLGIIGIPMRIKGTQENPKIKLGKGDKEELQETEYKEDEIKQ